LKKIDPLALYYETNYWVKKIDDYYLIGITDFAQTVFGNVNWVKFTNTTHLEFGDLFLEVETNKSITEIHTPVSGKILSKNTALENHPEWLNDDPYGKGWLVKILPTKMQDFEKFMNPIQYKDYMSVFFNKKNNFVKGKGFFSND